jgi:hypothetical protein
VSGKLSHLLERYRGPSFDGRTLVSTCVDAPTAWTETDPKDVRQSARTKTDSRVEWHKDAGEKNAAF